MSKGLEQVYDTFFYEKKVLSSLPLKPKLIIGSTNLQTARPFSFTKNRMWDTSYGSKDRPTFDATQFPIARAVMASSCVPFAFTPIRIAKPFILHPKILLAERHSWWMVVFTITKGIHKIMQDNRSLNTIIASDAECGSTGELKLKNTFTTFVGNRECIHGQDQEGSNGIRCV
jgi:NTE family protein